MYRHAALNAGPLVLALGLSACHSSPAGAPAPAGIRFEARDPRRCLPSREVPPADLGIVRACAEAFVLHNGYTPVLAPRDTSLLVREPFEIGSWSLLTERRRYTIEPKAVLADCDASGCIVFFRRFVRSQGCLAVTLSRDYDRLQFGRPAEAELVRRSAQARCF